MLRRFVVRNIVRLDWGIEGGTTLRMYESLDIIM